ncbi:hypothetical protein NDU88_003127 [Pleurodeles waltl]|uniref:Uncharacterized protein n=1 Tax=Pleurodeles waltl TaxID=8319 RepID=A0AAV7SEN1_PLEWA|nr:hypothetical protein NDU88_003127 [Pleurodeles waltl]
MARKPGPAKAHAIRSSALSACRTPRLAPSCLAGHGPIQLARSPSTGHPAPQARGRNLRSRSGEDLRSSRPPSQPALLQGLRAQQSTRGLARGAAQRPAPIQEPQGSRPRESRGATVRPDR